MKQKIEAHKINKPFQLLAAWLVGLVLINGIFLTSANLIAEPKYLKAILVIASVINVPMFLICVFLLQTKFRVEMQEDEYYSKHLSYKNEESGEEHILTLESEFLIGEIQKINERVNILSSKVNSISKTPIISDVIEIDKAFINEELDIQINDKLTNYDSIRTELEQRDVRIGYSFGSSSLDPVKPQKFVLSYNTMISLKDLQNLVALLRPYGLQALYKSDPKNSDKDPFAVYIGSYIYKKKNVGLLTDQDFSRLLDERISESEFHDFVNTHNSISM